MWIASRGMFEGVERTDDSIIGPTRTQGLQFGSLLAGDALIYIKDVRGFLLDDEVVDSNDDLLFGLNRALVLVGRDSAISFCGYPRSMAFTMPPMASSLPK